MNRCGRNRSSRNPPTRSGRSPRSRRISARLTSAAEPRGINLRGLVPETSAWPLRYTPRRFFAPPPRVPTGTPGLAPTDRPVHPVTPVGRDHPRAVGRLSARRRRAHRAGAAARAPRARHPPDRGPPPVDRRRSSASAPARGVERERGGALEQAHALAWNRTRISGSGDPRDRPFHYESFVDRRPLERRARARPRPSEIVGDRRERNRTSVVWYPKPVRGLYATRR